ncbi:MAG: Yip1 family protein [Porticoccaceae bacterium]
MGEILGIIFKPAATWQSLASKSEESIKARLLLVLALAAIPAIAFYYGTTQVGWNVRGGEIVRITEASATPLAVLFYAAMVSTIIVIGLMCQWMSKTYNADSFPLKGVVMVGYACVPVYLAGAAAVYPIWELDIVLATLACCYTIRLLYLGVPPMMNVPEDQGMLYASALFLVFLVYAVVILTATVILWEYVAAPVFINV